MADNRILTYAEREAQRQKETLTLIASENSIYPEALRIAQYPLSNKYSEGYPGRRFYCGCEWIDKIEHEAIEITKELFGCKYSNVQCYSGSIANLCIYKALIQPGDLIFSMDMSSGGHLTHSSSYSFVTHYYQVETYTVDRKTGFLNYENIRQKALLLKPKLIIAGGSSYPFSINFKKFREIADEVGAYLLADICHLSGFIVAGLHEHCFPHAHVAMCTTHKQLRGYRGSLIMWNDELLSAKINKSVFPGTQGGMNPAAVAINAYCLGRNLEDSYKEYMNNVSENAKIMVFCFRNRGVEVIGTETHMFLIDTKRSFNLTGKEASSILEKAGYITNPNLIPFDTESPLVTSGIRLGTLYLSTLNPTKQEVEWISDQIYLLLKNADEKSIKEAREGLKAWLETKHGREE